MCWLCVAHPSARSGRSRFVPLEGGSPCRRVATGLCGSVTSDALQMPRCASCAHEAPICATRAARLVEGEGALWQSNQLAARSVGRGTVRRRSDGGGWASEVGRRPASASGYFPELPTFGRVPRNAPFAADGVTLAPACGWPANAFENAVAHAFWQGRQARRIGHSDRVIRSI